MRQVSDIGPTCATVHPGARCAGRHEPSQEFSTVIRKKQETGPWARLEGRALAGQDLIAAALGRASAPEQPAVPVAGRSAWPDRGVPDRLGLEGDGQRREGADPVPVVRDAAAEPELLDPLTRALAGAPAPSIANEDSAFRSVVLPPEPALFRLLRRVAWGGSRRASAVYLELGSGELAGASLTLTSAAGQVSVVLELPPGVGASDWEQRLQARLASRGLNVLSVTVR